MRALLQLHACRGMPLWGCIFGCHCLPAMRWPVPQYMQVAVSPAHSGLTGATHRHRKAVHTTRLLCARLPTTRSTQPEAFSSSPSGALSHCSSLAARPPGELSNTLRQRKELINPNDYNNKNTLKIISYAPPPGHSSTWAAP